MMTPLGQMQIFGMNQGESQECVFSSEEEWGGNGGSIVTSQVFSVGSDVLPGRS
jgi:hypothetical protein